MIMDSYAEGIIVHQQSIDESFFELRSADPINARNYLPAFEIACGKPAIVQSTHNVAVIQTSLSSMKGMVSKASLIAR